MSQQLKLLILAFLGPVCVLNFGALLALKNAKISTEKVLML